MGTAVQSSNKSDVTENRSARFVTSLEDGLDQLVSCHGLSRTLLNRVRSPIEHCLTLALVDNDCAIPVNQPNQPWGWEPLLNGPEISIGKLTVLGEQDIPLHDHPGSTGLLLVLAGQVTVRHYKMLESSNTASPTQLPSPIELEQTGATILMTGQYSHFGPQLNNIHTLSAVDDSCILLDVLFSPYQLQQRTFFLPIAAQSDSGTVFVSPLNKTRASAMH
jgi:hypothetical protein